MPWYIIRCHISCDVIFAAPRCVGNTYTVSVPTWLVWVSFLFNSLTLLMPRPPYCRKTRSIPWLLMPPTPTPLPTPTPTPTPTPFLNLSAAMISTVLSGYVLAFLHCESLHSMMTSWNGNIFRVSGPLRGEFTVNSPHKGQWHALSFDVCFDLCLNKRLNKQSRHRWFETPSS